MFSMFSKIVLKNSFKKTRTKQGFKKNSENAFGKSMVVLCVFFFFLHDLKMAVFREQLKTVF